MTPAGSWPVPPPASAGDLLDRPVHVTVRDYPEALRVLRREGVDLASAGSAPLRSLENADALTARLLDVTAWRIPSTGGVDP